MCEIISTGDKQGDPADLHFDKVRVIRVVALGPDNLNWGV